MKIQVIKEVFEEYPDGSGEGEYVEKEITVEVEELPLLTNTIKADFGQLSGDCHEIIYQVKNSNKRVRSYRYEGRGGWKNVFL